MSSDAVGKLSPSEMPLPGCSDLHHRRVERMFERYCETIDEEMYWRPETWTPAFARRFARMADRLASIAGRSPGSA